MVENALPAILDTGWTEIKAYAFQKDLQDALVHMAQPPQEQTAQPLGLIYAAAATMDTISATTNAA